MTAWPDIVLTAVVQVSAITGVVLLAMVCIRYRPTWTHSLAVFGLLAVLMTPLLMLVLPAQSWWRISGPDPDVTTLGERSPTLVSSTSTEPTPISDASSIAERSESFATTATQLANKVSNPATATARPPMTGSSREWLMFGVIGVWIIGSATAAVRWYRQYRRIRILLVALVNPTPISSTQADRLTSLGNEVGRAVGLRSFPPVVVSDLIPMPLVWGLRRPIIVVPTALLTVGFEEKLRDVLIHEAAHIARLDAWVCVVQRLAVLFWWWHPGVLLVNRAVNRAREELCDNFVLRHGDAAHYAETLLDVAQLCSSNIRIAPSLGLFERNWTLQSRIEGLFKPGRDTMTRTSRRTVVVMGLLFSAVCLLIGGSRGSEKEAQRTPTTKSGTSNVQATERSADKNPDAGLRKIAVQGRCVDDEENPLAGVRVIILRRSEDYRREVIASETISDANGEFKLQDVRTAMLDRGDLMAIGALKGYTTGMVSLAKPQEEVITTEIKLSGNPGTLSGTVRDVHGDPIVGATVYLPCFADLPLPGVRSAVTDKQGRYAISDLNRWDSESTRTFDANTGLGRVTTACYFWLMHPDYPKTMSQNSAVPQTVDVVLHPAAVVEGQVVDEVTSRPAAGVTVSAQGVGRHGWYQTTTDAEGRYRLLMTRDHYNIWAEADDRIAIAIKAIQAERGKTVTNADIRLVQGGFVVGTVFGADGKPISPEKDQRFSVAHHGPARPQTGAAVTSTLVKPDGTYRLRVAPGRNYIYAMNGSGSGVDVVVEDGQEETVNIDLNSKQPEFQRADADRELRRKIYEAAKLEDAEEQKKSLRD